MSLLKKHKKIECGKNCTICDSLINDNVHYEGHIVRYLKSQCKIDNLNTDNILLGDLEKVGWVVLKCDYNITNGGVQQDYFYQMNNNIRLKKKKYWNKINGTNREMLYGIENHDHDSRFYEVEDFNAHVDDIFQSDCDAINHHLQLCYILIKMKICINIIFQT